MRTGNQPDRRRPARQFPFVVSKVLAVALSLAGTMLSACGGGGGGGAVRINPPPTAPPPQPPPPPPGAPPYNTQGNVLVNTSGTAELRNVRTAGTLTKDGSGQLSLFGVNRFDSGTSVLNGSIVVDALLYSNVTIAPGAALRMVDGNIVGNVNNQGVVEIRSCAVWDYGNCGGIAGNYHHAATATWRQQLGLQSSGGATVAHITGTATLAGGTVEFYQTSNFFTGQPYSEHILHAAGGVAGQFDRFTSPGLFIEGSLRYEPRDVFFDLRRLSVLSVMSAAGIADAATLSSAAHLDAAFGQGDLFADAPQASLSGVQRQFLSSAASIQRIGDHGQAMATLDSLSGQAHASARALLLDRTAQPSRSLVVRLDRLQQGALPGQWSDRSALGGHVAQTGSFGASYSSDGQVSGYDQWLGERWLVGSSVGWDSGRMQFERLGGQVRSESPQWNTYLRYSGNGGWYAGGLVGHSRTRLTADRPLDLGLAGRHYAHSTREVDLTHTYVEIGREFHLGQGRLTPFTTLNYAFLRSEGFTELGDTGFELAVKPSRSEHASADVGVRYARNWQFENSHWLRLDLSGHYQRLLDDSGEPLRAAFVGTPLAQFDIDGMSMEDGYSWLGLGLEGGRGERWSWFLNGDRRFGGAERNDAWTLGMRFQF